MVEVRGESSARLPASSEPRRSYFTFSNDSPGSNINRYRGKLALSVYQSSELTTILEKMLCYVVILLSKWLENVERHANVSRISKVL